MCIYGYGHAVGLYEKNLLPKYIAISVDVELLCDVLQ